MSQILLLNEAELQECVSLDSAAIACVEEAFVGLATRPVVMPPVLRLDIADFRGEVDVKTAYVSGLDSFAIKISPGFFDNPKLGLPSLSGMVVVLSARTGMLEALLLDNGLLTRVRTAAAGAVAARWLARPDAQRAAVLGAGEQARLQLQALLLVRPIDAATVWSPDPAKSRRFADEVGADLDLPITPCDDIDSAVSGADVVITATPSERPLIEPRHLRPGMHVTAMGSDAPQKNEIAPAALAAATCYVCDRLSQVRVLGELHHAIEAGAVAADATPAELGQVVAGRRPGRVARDDVTVCDLTGTGAQDTAIAVFALRRARRDGRGRVLDA
jgi:ornithine cyclodeaminase